MFVKHSLLPFEVIITYIDELKMMLLEVFIERLAWSIVDEHSLDFEGASSSFKRVPSCVINARTTPLLDVLVSSSTELKSIN